MELKYGKSVVFFDPPPSWTVNLVEPKHPETRDVRETLLGALANPYGPPPFVEWLQDKAKILVVASDVTRYTGAERILPILREMYLTHKDVRVLFALGNHRKQTDAERRSLVSDAIVDAWPCMDHDCFDDEGLFSLGKTPSGLDVKVSNRLREADGIVVTGAISFHYLAGFGGGRKCIIPGVAGYQTILDTHKRVFHPNKPGKHEQAQTGILAGNPMHEAIMEGIALVENPLFLINTVFDDKKALLNIFAGEMARSHEAGCDWYNEHFSAMITGKADVVLVSVGGYPKDIDFIQTHKALEHAKHAAKDDGTIIVVGKCEDGIGNSYFLPWFEYPSVDAMEPHVREADKVYAQTAYSTRIKAERYRVILVSDLDANDVRKMGMVPKSSIQEAISSVEVVDGPLLCHVIPEGSKTLVRDQG